MYGKVHFENEDGEFRVVECQTQQDYDRELAAGCQWIEDEPRRFLNLWGERLGERG